MFDSVALLGERYVSLLNKLGIFLIRDLCFYLPSKYIDRTNLDLESPPGTIVTVLVKVITHFPPRNRKMPYRVLCETDDQCLTLVFFNYSIGHIKSILKIDSNVVISGKLSSEKSIVHPDYIETQDKFDEIAMLDPLYKSVKGLNNQTIRKLILEALCYVEEMEEWIDPITLRKFGWLSWRDSVCAIHTSKDKFIIKAALARLAYDELLVYLLKIQQLRKNIMLDSGIKIQGDGRLRKLLMKNLKFELTEDQDHALQVIYRDQASQSRMMKLLQGDVGCGKTVVALMAILNSAECGHQAVFMAPTEALANQHYHWIAQYVGDYVKIALITGKTSKRQHILTGLSSGEIDILIGTHALFGDKICFKHLALVVIDEQHRFGVDQRAKLIAKGARSDILMMSATPIPRSLNMVAYGELDVVYIKNKPKNRLKVQTLVYSSDKIDVLIKRIQEGNQKVYWICALIEETEGLKATDVNSRYENLVGILGSHRVGLVHGKTSAIEKDRVITQFRESRDMVLVATTVVEVGMDVHDASIIVIENAERFGLAQLHQLRGRVGRGSCQSYCVLLYDALSTQSYQRLKVLKECDDGFAIAEQDLELRGGGDLVGLKQSGWPKFWFFNPFEYSYLLKIVDTSEHSIPSQFQKLSAIFTREILPQSVLS